MNELQAVDQEKLNALLQQVGGGQAPDRVKIPFLKAHYDDHTFTNGDDVKKGWLILMVDGQNIYASTMKLRVLAQHYQWRLGEKVAPYAVINKSILMDDMRAEPRDMLGTMRCGRPNKNIWDEMSPDDRAPYRDIKCVRILRGIASFTGKDSKGEDITISNAPFQLFNNGMNFMGFESAIKQAKSSGKAHHEFWFDVTTKKEGKAWILEYKIDHATQTAWGSKEFETLEIFAEMAKVENSIVEKGYDASRQSKSGAVDGIYEALADDLDADFQ